MSVEKFNTNMIIFLKSRSNITVNKSVKNYKEQMQKER